MQRRRRRQRERQKSNRFRLAKQQLCTCITLFLYISLPSLHDYDVKRPNSTFFGEREYKTTTFLFFSWTSIQSFRIQLQKKKLCQHLTNWTRRNKRYLVWSSLNSPFKWRFHSHRRLCCLSSLLISWTPPLKNKHLAAPNARIFQLFVLGCLPFVKTDLPDQFNCKGSSTINHGCQASQFLNTLRDRNGF